MGEAIHLEIYEVGKMAIEYTLLIQTKFQLWILQRDQLEVRMHLRDFLVILKMDEIFRQS